MPKVLSSFGMSKMVSETETVTPADTDGATGSFIVSDGSDTTAYEQQGADGGTFITTNLGRVNDAQVTVDVKAASVSEVVARPATEEDFDNADSYVEGTILIELYDASGAEIAAGDISDLELTYSAVRA